MLNIWMEMTLLRIVNAIKSEQKFKKNINEFYKTALFHGQQWFIYSDRSIERIL